MSEAGIRARWGAKLKARLAGRSKARRARDAAQKRLEERRSLVDAARRVLKRHAPKAHTAVGPSRMFDAIHPEVIPADAEAVAGYVGGHWPTFSSGELARRFPKARRVSIAVASTQDAEVLDVEPGDAPPSLAAAWVKRQKARGVKRPAIYCSLSTVPLLLRLLAEAGISRSEIRLWTAHYTHVPHICSPACGNGMRTTADATQFTDRSHGRSLDESLVAPSFWQGR